MQLRIRQGFDYKTVDVLAISDVRGPASMAQLLYQETPESLAERAEQSAQRQAMNLAHPDHRPNKKERRQIHRFQRNIGDNE